MPWDISSLICCLRLVVYFPLNSISSLICCLRHSITALLAWHLLCSITLTLLTPCEFQPIHLCCSSRSTSPEPISRTSDGSGMESANPEDHLIIRPSSLGWAVCVCYGLQSLALKEAKLHHAQANGFIHWIHLALGFKAALFRDHVRPAKTQQTKTCAWNAIHSVDTTVHELAHVYSMANNLYQNIQEAYGAGPHLPQLHIKDMVVETTVLGSEMVGQCNKQLSWIWGFSHTVNDQGTWMEDCKVPYAKVSDPYTHIWHMAVERVALCKGPVWEMGRRAR